MDDALQGTPHKIVRAPPSHTKAGSVSGGRIIRYFHDVWWPHILQSDNGREFTANVISELASLWP